MIELWSWPYPSGQKVHILLEETGLPYAPTAVNTAEGERVNQEFLSLTPNYRIPAIFDPHSPHGPIRLSESGAILIYLAEKAGNFIPVPPAERYLCLQWLMFHMNGIGPAFRHGAGAELRRLLGVLERRLGEDDFLAGTYSIADMAVYPWIAGADGELDLDTYPALKRWSEKLAARPAVERGMSLMRDLA